MRLRWLAFVLALATSAPGCGGADVKDDRPDPVSSRVPAQDAPGPEEGQPPLGKPRGKVAPLATDRGKESLLREDPAH